MPENVAAKTKKEQKNPKSKFQTECSSKKEKKKNTCPPERRSAGDRAGLG
jgi:hypothetical protein